jgi:hypothetical protein
MACFWNGILQQLTTVDLKVLGIQNKNPQSLVQAFKQKAKKTNSVRWNGDKLSNKQLDENLQHIQTYNIKTIGNGYLCSSCEPFLLLLSELLQVHIHHNYLHTSIKYTITDYDDNITTDDNITAARIMKFGSNRGHFWSGHNGHNGGPEAGPRRIPGHNGVPGRPKGRAQPAPGRNVRHGHGRQPVRVPKK